MSLTGDKAIHGARRKESSKARFEECAEQIKKGMEYEQNPPEGHRDGVPVQGDASGPSLTYYAERDYFTLRERTVIITGQVSYLEDYIREQRIK